MRCYRRHRQEEHACGKRASVAPLSTLLASVRHQLVTFLALQLRSQSDPPTNHSPLYTLIAEEQMPFDMVVCLVTLLTEDESCPTAFGMIFSPLLQHCLAEARRHKALTSAHYLTPAMVLTSLTKIKLVWLMYVGSWIAASPHDKTTSKPKDDSLCHFQSFKCEILL